MKQFLIKASLFAATLFFMSSSALAQTWDFENGITGNWMVNTGTVEASTDVAYGGSYSLKVISGNSSALLEFENQVYKDAQPTDTLKYKVWVNEANKAKINGFNVFLKEGSNWQWAAEWTGSSDLTAGGWTSLSLVVPDSVGTVQAIGIQLNETAASNITTFYVDAIEVSPEVEPEPIIDTVFDFEDGLGDFAVTNGTAEESSDFTLSGITSVKITGADGQTGTDFENATYTNINPGDTVSFNLWATSITDINGFQVYIKNGNSFDFISEWIDAGDISLSTWNKLSFVVPNTVNDVRAFGFQLNHASSATPSVYIDDATISPFDPNSVEPLDPVYNAFDFEDGTSGPWSVKNDNGNAAVVDTTSFSGSSSVALSLNPDGDKLEFANYSPEDYAPNQVITMNVWVPQDTSNIESISAYVQYDLSGPTSWDGWTSGYYTPQDLDTGTWNEISVTVPLYTDTLRAIGFEIIGKTASGSPDFFLDLVSSDPNVTPLPTVSVPGNLVQDSVGTTYAAFSWDASSGNNFAQYNIHRDELYIGYTHDSSFVDTTVESETGYSYTVAAIDTFGRSTPASDPLTINTEAFNTHFTWDFENGLDGWRTHTENTGSISISDTIAYSGFHSAQLLTPESSGNGTIGVENISPEAGQTFRFHFYVPADTSNIRAFSLAAFIDGAYNVKDWPVENFEPGTWNKITFQVPEYSSFDHIDFNVVSKTTGAPPVFIDLVTTDPNEKGIATITVPANLSAGAVTNTSVELDWTASEGLGGNITYNVYSSSTSIEELALSELTLHGNTSGTEFEVTGLEAGTQYFFTVTGVDATGKETGPSNETSATTTDFDTHATFDFETGFQGWTTAQGSAGLTDSISYSGVYSVKFTSDATESFFEFIDTDTEDAVGDIIPGHTITYQVWIPQEHIPNIELFQIWYKDGGWGWSSNVIETANMQADTWNEFSVTIDPASAGLNSVGFQIIKNEGAPDPTVFIDLVSTQANPLIRPHLSVPGNLTGEAVELSYILTWESSTGNDILEEYKVYRREVDSDEEFEEVGTTVDTTFSGTGPSGFQEFYVTAVAEDGRESEASVSVELALGGLSVEDENGIPEKFALSYNYPNPFNPTTRIKYDVPVSSEVTLKVYNITGQLVQTLVNGTKNAGRYTVTFRGDNLASGVYFYRLDAGSFTKVRRMMLIK